MFCNACGHNNLAGSNFCASCGNQLNAPALPQQPNPANQPAPQVNLTPEQAILAQLMQNQNQLMQVIANQQPAAPANPAQAVPQLPLANALVPIQQPAPRRPELPSYNDEPVEDPRLNYLTRAYFELLMSNPKNAQFTEETLTNRARQMAELDLDGRRLDPNYVSPLVVHQQQLMQRQQVYPMVHEAQFTQLLPRNQRPINVPAPKKPGFIDGIARALGKERN